MDTNPQKLLDKAKIGLMMAGSAFICSVAFSMRHVFNGKIKTADVDGKTIQYNPDFFISLTPEQRISLIAHETWHPILMHMIRAGNRDKKVYNEAGDYVINQLLLDSSLVPIPGWLQDNKYKGMTTNQVYDILIAQKSEDSPSGSNGDIVYSPVGNKEAAAELEADLSTVLIRAQMQSQISNDPAGSVPGDIQRMIDALINPVLTWTTLLDRFLSEQAKNDYSWKRPNKRFMPEFYMPSMYSETLPHITIAIDTSGSISESDLRSILSEIEFIRDTYKPERLTIIDCDYKIHNVFEVTPDTNILELKFKGGGGTCCYPVFEHCETSPTNVLIYFTDLYLRKPFIGDVDYPVLWVVYDNPQATVNVGELIHYNIKG